MLRTIKGNIGSGVAYTPCKLPPANAFGIGGLSDTGLSNASVSLTLLPPVVPPVKVRVKGMPLGLRNAG